MNTKELALNTALAGKWLQRVSTSRINCVLENMATILRCEREYILKENSKDIEFAIKNGLSTAFIERLTLSEIKIESMASSIETIQKLTSPIGEVVAGFVHENGMSIEQIRVPIGTILMIYESRPNVTVDAAALALKSQNSIILRGGSDAYHTNTALFTLIQKVLEEAQFPKNVISMLDSKNRDELSRILSEDQSIDVVIPRGGKALKEFIAKNSTIPMIETGSGLCHAYVDEFADIEKAISIIINAKTQRPGVCNAMETLIIHHAILPKIAPMLEKALIEKRVELRACENSIVYFSQATLATTLDFETEYLVLILSIKSVENIDEAISHINQYGSKHSEVIITENYANSEIFLNLVDAACVYVNASSRFTDGGVFGFGGEIGISTQKLHARGPMGLRELTTLKYKIRGSGQIR